MKTKNKITIILSIALVVFSFTGCSIYGKIKKVSLTQQEKEIDSLLADLAEYNVFYSGYGEKNPSGIMFDPKKDKKQITFSDRWTKIEGQREIAGIMEWIRMGRYPGYDPVLSKILGPDGQFYGYLFTGWSYVVIRGVTTDTVYIYDLQDPPQYLGNGGSVFDEH
jgi:hypothetical protein